MLISVLGFLVMLGPLVVFHEFGHYLFARLFGVKAEVFSVGFGPKIWSRKIGETEWCVSALPLGGYVKLLGEDRTAELKPSESKRALHKQAAWKRFFIFFGGPLFNFIFAALLFMAILVVGEPHVAAVASRVVEGSVAARAGLQSGDRVLAVNGTPVNQFEELAGLVADNPGKPLLLKIERAPGKSIEIRYTPSTQTGYTIYGEEKEIGDLGGILPLPRGLKVGISSPDSLAAKVGIRPGDVIARVNGMEPKSWEAFEAIVSQAPVGSVVRIQTQSMAPQSAAQLIKPAAGESPAQAWGLHSSELFIDKTVAGSPAEKAGVKSGDRVVSIGGKEVKSFYDLKAAVQAAGERGGKIAVQWEREGKLTSAQLLGTATAVRDPLLKQKIQYTIGIIPQWVGAEPDKWIERVWNPFKLVYLGVERMLSVSWKNLVSIQKLLTGEVSVGALGGPIMIGKIAGEALSLGLVEFLMKMAVLSVGLGVLNVLPVPVLDGGHILLLGVEVVRRKPLSLKQLELIQGFGLVLILLLMGVVLKNDLTRVF